MDQKDQEYKKAMLRGYMDEKRSEKAKKLDILDKDRYYFERLKMYDRQELIDRNSKKSYILGEDYRKREDIAGKHTVGKELY